MSAARRELWSRARSLSDSAGGGLGPRMRRLAVQGDGALNFDDLCAPPDWALGDAAERASLARMVGAVLVSRSWSVAIDGAVLGRAAQSLGEGALDALMNLPDVVAPSVSDPQAENGDAAALDRLGASALVSAARASAALSRRLSRLFPAGLAPAVPPARAALAQRTAEGLARELEGAA